MAIASNSHDREDSRNLGAFTATESNGKSPTSDHPIHDQLRMMCVSAVTSLRRAQLLLEGHNHISEQSEPRVELKTLELTAALLVVRDKPSAAHGDSLSSLLSVAETLSTMIEISNRVQRDARAAAAQPDSPANRRPELSQMADLGLCVAQEVGQALTSSRRKPITQLMSLADRAAQLEGRVRVQALPEGVVGVRSEEITNIVTASRLRRYVNHGLHAASQLDDIRTATLTRTPSPSPH
jgi:hypothetical protein